jgi:hypothetical protein
MRGTKKTTCNPTVLTSSNHGAQSGGCTFRFSSVDVVVLSIFLVFAIATFLGRWKGITPFAFLSSDAGIVSSFVAAYDHPDLFKGDVLLSDFNNFRYYMAFHPLLIHFINKIVSDYGVSYILLLLFTTLVQSVGFYILGLVVFRSRYWAFLLSLITLCPVALPIREFWGIYDDPLPRSLFHAVLPYLLAAAFYLQDSGRSWACAWLMVGAGIAFYTHPVSVPHWAFALWLGIWFFLPTEWTWLKKTWRMLLLGLVFVAMVFPWAANLVFVHKHALESTVRYKDIVPIIAERVGPELLNIRIALQDWWNYICSWPVVLYFLWGCVGSIVGVYFFPPLRKRIMLIFIWAAGILFVAVGLTFMEETLCKMCDVGRFQMDSVRGIKYLVPLMLLLCLIPLAQISSTFASRSLGRSMTMLAGALIMFGWAYQNPPSFFIDSVRSWLQGEITPPISETEKAIVEAVEIVHKDTPNNSRLLALSLPLEIRYSALRPIVYAYKDGGIFADTNYSALVTWNDVKNEIESITAGLDSNEKSTSLRKLYSLSVSLRSDYALVGANIDREVANTCGWDILWSNKLFSLMRIKTASS